MKNSTGMALSLSVVLSACGGGQSGALPPTTPQSATPPTPGGNVDPAVQNTGDSAAPAIPDTPVFEEPLNPDNGPDDNPNVKPNVNPDTDPEDTPAGSLEENTAEIPVSSAVEIEPPLTSTPPAAPELPPAARVQLDESGFMACIRTSLRFSHTLFGYQYENAIRAFYTPDQCSVSGDVIEQRTDTPGPAGNQTDQTLYYQACRNIAGVLDGEVSHSLTRPLSVDEERVEQREHYTVAYASSSMNEHLETTVSTSDLFYIDTTSSSDPAEWTSHQNLTRLYSNTLWHRTGLDERPLAVSNASGSYEISTTLNSDEHAVTAVNANHTLVGCHDTAQADLPEYVDAQVSVNYDFPMRLIADEQRVLSARVQLQAANGAVALLSSTDDPDTAEVVLYLDSRTPPITRNIEWTALLPTR